jgi:hypothetical protein
VVADAVDRLVRALLEGDDVEPDRRQLRRPVLALHLGRAQRARGHRRHAEDVVANRGRGRRVDQPGRERVAVGRVGGGQAARAEEDDRCRPHRGVGRECCGPDPARLDRLHVGRQEARLVGGADAGERRREHEAEGRDGDPGGNDDERCANDHAADPVEHRRERALGTRAGQGPPVTDRAAGRTGSIRH